MIIENYTRWSLGFVSVLATIILSGGIALAQTAPTTAKPSDYAVDVSQGQQTLLTDPVAAAQAKEVNDSENDEGGIDNEPAEIKEAVEPSEAEEAVEPAEAEEQAETNEGGEASGSNNSDGGSNSERSGSSNENE